MWTEVDSKIDFLSSENRINNAEPAAEKYLGVEWYSGLDFVAFSIQRKDLIINNGTPVVPTDRKIRETIIALLIK